MWTMQIFKLWWKFKPFSHLFFARFFVSRNSGKIWHSGDFVVTDSIPDQYLQIRYPLLFFYRDHPKTSTPERCKELENTTKNYSKNNDEEESQRKAKYIKEKGKKATKIRGFAIRWARATYGKAFRFTCHLYRFSFSPLIRFLSFCEYLLDAWRRITWRHLGLDECRWVIWDSCNLPIMQISMESNSTRARPG